MRGIFGCIGVDKDFVYLDNENFAKYNENFILKKNRYSNGITGIYDLQNKINRSFYIEEEITVCFFGDLYSFNNKEPNDKNFARYVYQLYKKHGTNFISNINGSFALSIHDKNKLIIANDKLGTQPIFLFKNKESFIYSSEIKGILLNPNINFNFDMVGLTEFFAFSYILDNRTLYQNIEILEAGTILVCENNNLIKIKYFNLEINRDDNPLKMDFYFKEFDKIFEKAIYDRVKEKTKVGLFLSGGLDSRLIVSYLDRVCKKNNIELITFTFGPKGCRQEFIAREISNILKIKNIFIEIPSTSIKDHAEEIALKGDGIVRIRDAHFISCLEEVKKSVDFIVAGLFCSESFGEEMLEQVKELKNKEELKEHLFGFRRIKQNWSNLENIFVEGLVDNPKKIAKNNFMKTVESGPYKNVYFSHDYWEITQRDWRYIIPISTYLNWYFDTCLPFVDDNVISFALNLPTELRIEKRFIHKMVNYAAPELINVSYEKSGVPPDTKGLKLIISKYRIIGKIVLKRIIEKLTKGKILVDVKDYRSYDSYLRKGSKKFMLNLLDEYNGNIFKKESIIDIGKKHIQGENFDQTLCDIILIIFLEKLYINNQK